MKIAIPLVNGKLCDHFGHCEKFAIFTIDRTNRKIIAKKEMNPPAHQPGVFPYWLSHNGVKLIIAAGMGQRAQKLFADYNISYLVGAQGVVPDDLVKNYLNDQLDTQENLCEH